MATQLDHYRLLGRSGLRVSPLSLGTMTFGAGTWGTDYEQAKAIVKTYRDNGGNFIDTANFYSMGESESMLGKLLKSDRDDVVLSTKYSLTMAHGKANASGNHRKNMVQSVEASLKRLNFETIDLLYLHLWDSFTPAEEIMRALDDLVRAGKVLYTGISDTPAWVIAQMQTMAELRAWSPFIALQIPYNLTERCVEAEFMPMAKALGLGVIPWSPLAGGVLSGKYSQADLEKSQQNPKQLNSRKDINLATGRLTNQSLQIAAVVTQIAKENNCTPAQIALAWTQENTAVTAPTLGVRTLEQLEDNLGSLDVHFSQDQLERLNAISQPPLSFPHTLINQPTGNGMLGNVQVERR